MRAAVAALVLLPLLFTLAVLAAVALNRRGDDLRAPIVLSEREVSLTPRNDDNSATAVWLAWRDRPLPLIERRGTRDLPRRVFVALYLDQTRTEGSRLTVVDVDADATVLEQRYPDGRTHVISAGLVRTGDVVVNLDPVRVHVPRELAGRLPPWRAVRDPAASRRPFTVSLRYGRHWEPWVVAIGE